MTWTDPNMSKTDRGLLYQVLTIDLWDGGSQDFSMGLAAVKRSPALDRCTYGESMQTTGPMARERRKPG